MKTVHVAAAVIVDDGKILCVLRSANKLTYISEKWEFPGGKIEPNESIEETVVREIQEELNLTIQAETFLVQVDHVYPDFRLIMDTFLCKIIDGTLQLNEHIDHAWLTKDKLNSLDWAQADLPIVEKLRSLK